MLSVKWMFVYIALYTAFFSCFWWVYIVWLPDAHQAVLSLPLLNRTQEESKMKKLMDWDKDRVHFPVTITDKPDLGKSFFRQQNKNRNTFPLHLLPNFSPSFPTLVPLFSQVVQGMRNGGCGQLIKLRLCYSSLLMLFPCSSVESLPWVPSFTNFSNVALSHELQFFKNCSNVGFFHQV